MRVLVVEDDRALGVFLGRGLESDGHRVHVVHDGGAAMEDFLSDLPDLTVLDLNLPVHDGMEVLRAIRSHGSEAPVLILTGRPDVETRVCCFDLGADDLMTKPFSLHELRARCRALLRRRRGARLLLCAGDVQLDRVNHTVRRAGQEVALTNKEFSLLEHLLLRRGQSVTRMELLEEVWKVGPAQSTNVVDVYINYLRRKLNDASACPIIRTVRGQGYMIPRQAELTGDLHRASVSPLAPAPMPMNRVN